MAVAFRRSSAATGRTGGLGSQRNVVVALACTFLIHFWIVLHWKMGRAAWQLHSADDGNAQASNLRGDLRGQVWSGNKLPPDLALDPSQVAQLLTDKEHAELEALCGRCLADQLFTANAEGNGHKVFVATGDIPAMWIRDSAVQLGSLIPRMAQQPALRLIVEGGVRTQATFIVMDAYANSYNLKWQPPSSLQKHDRILGRGGWVSTRNYELDSGAYFLHLLYDLYLLPGYGHSALLREPVVFEAASLLLRVWTTEQQHEAQSEYRYAELPRDGRGAPSNYTGMSWSGFRPSDDQQQYGFNIPVNMYAVAAVERACELNKALWKDRDFGRTAAALAESMREGIEQWGVVTVDGVKVYAYEVDGLGGQLTDFDDANVPSLLSIPLLGYRFDPAIYQATRARILSAKNPHFYKGQHLQGIGSPHTPANSVWALAIAVQGLTAQAADERAGMLRMLLKMQCGSGLMHESVNADNLSSCTRIWFGWANSMLVALIESGMGIDCTSAGERSRIERIKERELHDESVHPANGGADDPRYYATSTANIGFDRDTIQMPEPEI